MRVETEYRQYAGSIWLKRGGISYGANWYGTGPIRKRVMLKAMMQKNERFYAPWLWA